MLQSLRENLKGAVAIFVLLIFIVPLVLFGVEQLFVSSVGGNDAGKVNGEEISLRQLQREIQFDKMRLQQQFQLEPTDPKLDDAELRGPALDRLVRRLALFQEAKSGSMGVAKDELWKEITSVEGFQTDGKFDYNLFKDRINNFFTPATYLDASAKDYVLRQLNGGLGESTFITESDLKLIASITQQKRTFYSIEIPKSSVGEVSVTPEEIAEFYEANSARYMEPEMASVEYLELSLDELAKQNPPSAEEVKSAYDLEVSEFKPDPKYQVAHILIEDGEKSAQTIKLISEKLTAGEDFEKLATEYSDDLGSKESGGSLGELVTDAFPKEFVAAAKNLSVGQVSEPVKTDSGTHFIKMLDITNVKPASFEERKEALAQQLARQKAQDQFIVKSAKLDELTFGVDSLQAAAAALNLEVKTSAEFGQAGGAGIAAYREVAAATFADDVLKQNQNSRVLELAGDKAVVLRLKSYKEASLKPLAEVESAISSELKEEMINTRLEAKATKLKSELQSGAQPKAVADDSKYSYQMHEATKRNNFEINRMLLTKVFSLPRPMEGKEVIEVVETSDGYSVVSLQSVTDGSLADLSEQELSGIKNQLEYQFAQTEMSNFEQSVVEAAKVKITK